PRWASWNLGIFICIRCAGIHRNLGVHISKVKSVNLDQWTQEQVQCVQEMGNAKAKRLYEAFLPECFQRPETDQTAEIFIRDKYDKKKYMDKVIDIQMLRGRRFQPASKSSSCFLLLAYHLGKCSSIQLLGLFMDPKAKTDEGNVKKLSKDSILSLYASTPSLHASSMAPHGLYMNRMGFPTHPYGPYHSLAQVGGMGGAMMTSQMAMMGQQQSGLMGVHQNSTIGAQQNCMMGQQNGLAGAQGVVPQPSGVVTTPYMTGIMGQQQSGMLLQQQTGVLAPQQSGMMGQQQVGAMAPLPQQQVYGVQQGQQLQWNMAQVCAS
ncbi:hypothetical protein GOODEAATRI_003756, partial [Goodea atripinnis]